MTRSTNPRLVAWDHDIETIDLARTALPGAIDRARDARRGYPGSGFGGGGSPTGQRPPPPRPRPHHRHRHPHRHATPRRMRRMQKSPPRHDPISRKGHDMTKQTPLEWVDTDRCIALRRNPQYLTPHTMDALKASIERDGFLAPVLLRKMRNGDYEVVSGNHRVMAARELGMAKIPAVVANLTKAQAQRVAVNLNTVHGDPTAELLAPFLAELDDDTLATVHLSDAMLQEVAELDEQLQQRFDQLTPPDGWDNDSVNTPIGKCVCPTCGRQHIKAEPSTDDES